MLTCVYHPIDPMRVVEHDEAYRLLATGVWFDCPAKARNYKQKVEEDVKNEKAEVVRPKAKRQMKEQLS